MAVPMSLLQNASRIRSFSSIKRSFYAGKIIYNKQSEVASAAGLSSSVVDVPKEPVGPGASKDSNYKNPEYFCYNNTSYFQAEVEILKYRLPVLDSKVYYEYQGPK